MNQLNQIVITSEQDIKHTKCVYVFKNNNDEVLYVGRTSNLYQRLKSHFSNGEYSEWKKEIAQINYYPYLYVLDTYYAEIYLIGLYKPIYNKEYSEITNCQSINTIKLSDEHTLSEGIVAMFKKEDIKKLRKKSNPPKDSNKFTKVFISKDKQTHTEVATTYSKYNKCSLVTAKRHVKYAINNNILNKENNLYSLTTATTN